MTTISASTTLGIILTGIYTNPIVIPPGVSITGYYNGYAVYASSGYWNITNSGSIAVAGGGGAIRLAGGGAVSNEAGGTIGSPAPNCTGVYILGGTGAVTNAGSIASVWLQGGGSVANQSGGTITGGNTSGGYGVGMHLAGTVTNAGAISGPLVGIDASYRGGTVTNMAGGVITGQYVGVIMGIIDQAGTGGRTVVNQAGGTISGDSGILTGGGAAAVYNAGVILGTSAQVIVHGTITLAVGPAVTMSAGGSVTNAPGGTIDGHGYGIGVSGGAATVFNGGRITATGTSSGGVKAAIYVRNADATVTNAASASIAGFEGVWIFGAGTVVNYGSITGVGSGIDITDSGVVTNAVSASISAQDAVLLQDGTIVNGGTIDGLVQLGLGGTVTNAASGLIAGSVGFGNGTGTVTNDGRITGGVELQGGGTVTNAISASIEGNFNGVHAIFFAATVFNDGTITATNSAANGVELVAGGSMTNGASASIEAGYGVEVWGGGGTLTNAGTIIGSTGTAAAFHGTGANLLVLDPGFAFSGMVAGSTSASNRLELASAASPGIVTGLGTEFTNFGPIAFDAGASWFIAGDTSGLAGSISGFAQGDTIEFSGETATGSSFVSGILTIDLAGGHSATLDLPGTFTSASDFDVTNVAAGADVTVACFATGARIHASAGEVPVEKLTPSDRLPTASGRLARIVWCGRQRTSIPPVRVRACAFGDRLPMRDLLLSPDHAVFVDGVLVPVRHLINGSTIVQEPVDEITYYHVELAAHDVILAEGLPCESYLDTGNRAAFVSGGDERPLGEHDRLTATSRHQARY